MIKGSWEQSRSHSGSLSASTPLSLCVCSPLLWHLAVLQREVGGWGGGCPPCTGPGLLQSMAGHEGLHVRRGLPWSVLIGGWARAGASWGQRQQEQVWEAGLAPVLSCWLRGTSCAELSPAAAAKPRCSRDAAALPATACARTRDEQNNSCFPGSPSRAERASGGQRGQGGLWDEAGGARQPAACYSRCQKKRQISDRQWG